MEGFTPAEAEIRAHSGVADEATPPAIEPDPRQAWREQYAAEVAALFTYVARHPDIPMPHVRERHVSIYVFGEADERAAIAASARAFRCTWDKRAWESDGDAFFEMTGTWEGWHIKLSAHRDAVCRRVVTGTEVREVDEVVTPAVTKKVRKPVEIVTWECEPVMAPAAAVVAA